MLGLSQGRATGRDPIVNGYSRRVRGVLADRAVMPGLNVDAGVNNATSAPVASNAGVMQATTTQGPPNFARALCGVQLGSALVYHGERGANGGPELWNAGVYTTLSQQALGITQTYKIAIDGTTIRAYNGGGLFGTFTDPTVTRGTAFIYLQNDGNPDNAANAAYSNVVATRDNQLHFANCPASGSVSFKINGGATITVPLDINGAATYDLGGQQFPFQLALTIQDAASLVQSVLAIPRAYGGDEYGRVTPTPSVDPNNFTVGRPVSGLLFFDNFNRPDGAPGANWIIENGVWAIVANRLRHTMQNNTVLRMRLAAGLFAARAKMVVQAKLATDDTRTFMQLTARNDGTNFYYYSHAASDAGSGQANSSNICRWANGGATNVNLAFVAAPARVAGATEVVTIAVDNGSQRGWINNANLVTAADVTAVNQVNGVAGLMSFANPTAVNGSFAYVDDFTVYSSTVISCSGLPAGWKIRAGGVTSAGAVGGAAAIDLLGAPMPVASVDILDAGGVVKQTWTPAGGLYGGDVLQLT